MSYRPNRLHNWNDFFNNVLSINRYIYIPKMKMIHGYVIHVNCQKHAQTQNGEPIDSRYYYSCSDFSKATILAIIVPWI